MRARYSDRIHKVPVFSWKEKQGETNIRGTEVKTGTMSSSETSTINNMALVRHDCVKPSQNRDTDTEAVLKLFFSVLFLVVDNSVGALRKAFPKQ